MFVVGADLRLDRRRDPGRSAVVADCVGALGPDCTETEEGGGRRRCWEMNSGCPGLVNRPFGSIDDRERDRVADRDVRPMESVNAGPRLMLLGVVAVMSERDDALGVREGCDVGICPPDVELWQAKANVP